ncbi:hypothetical protein [Micromonospora sp. NPDC004704]
MTAPTFVFVHGAASNSFTWAPMQRELALHGHRSLVYISAWCCVDDTPAGYQTSAEDASTALSGVGGLIAANPAELGALRFNWRTADPELLATLREATLADGTDHEFYGYLNTLEPDEGLDAGEERVDAGTWGRIPRTYVRAAHRRPVGADRAPGPVHRRGGRADSR